MLRILLLLLAVISAALAVILEMPWVFLIAGALVLALLLIWVLQARRRRQSVRREEASRNVNREQELASLGISEVRPRTSGSDTASEASEQPAEAAPHGRKESGVSPKAEPSSSGVRPASVQRMGTRRKAREGQIGEDRFAIIMAPYLQSLRAAISAQTVCLLKQDDIEPHYTIEAIVSQNSYARSGGHFSTKAPLITTTTHQDVIVENVGAGGLDPSSLGYYREPIQVRQVAIAPVPSSGDSVSYLLIADSMNEIDLREPYRQGLLAQFAKLLRSILDLVELEGNLTNGEPARPRREIIEEEIERTKNADRHLMLALIYLNDAEEIAKGGRIAVAAAERALESALKKSSDDRVERFGELTFGVFHEAETPDAEQWAVDLQHRLEAGRGALKGGTSIGIAVLRDRHESADMLREDATEALREAFETGACTIVD